MISLVIFTERNQCRLNTDNETRNDTRRRAIEENVDYMAKYYFYGQTLFVNDFANVLCRMKITRTIEMLHFICYKTLQIQTIIS